jgi:threonine dehydrogenase-like Zn-dependent dehydrogenase
MKHIELQNGKVIIKDVAVPNAAGNFALVKNTVIPACTEFKFYANGDTLAGLGHESSGIIEKVSGGSNLKVGDKVVVMPSFPCGECFYCKSGDYIFCQNNVDPLAACNCDYGTASYAEYCLKQDKLLLPVPADISLEHASLACCGLGPAFTANKKLNVAKNDKVLVVGLGPVGLGTVIVASYFGAEVIGIDPVGYRRQLAQKLGASATFAPDEPGLVEKLSSVNGGLGPDKTVVCVTGRGAIKFALEATRIAGEIAIVGWESSLEWENIPASGKSIHAVWHWNLNYTDEMFQLIRDNKTKLDKFITHKLPFDKVEEAWKIQINGECGKVLLLNP